MASEADIFFNFMFILLTYVLVYPPKEFQAVGLTVEQVAVKLRVLSPEIHQFVEYHICRTTINLVLHAALPLIYLTAYNAQFTGAEHFAHGREPVVQHLWSLLNGAAWLLLLAVVSKAAHDIRCDRHPLIHQLRLYGGSVPSAPDWRSVAASINNEFRRPEKMVARVNTITGIVATENWLVKTSLYAVRIAHQSDTVLTVVKSDTHLIAQDSFDSVQYVSIIVRPSRPGVANFNIRLNALDFAQLQDRISRPISILSGVNFSRTVVDRFVEAFKECVEANPTYETDQELDQCFACMQAVPNVKLQRRCEQPDDEMAPAAAETRCGNCFCRPMWCVDCLAKWFASRQNPAEKDVWLQQKCSCPMCRSRFCLHDVCMVRKA